MEEEEQKKRWSVTYTKHLKQKRKVYQDGFLHLHIPTSKLMLYDESEEKLLESRKLREDEVVSSANTLSFSSYLVDVSLLQPSSNFQSDLTRKNNEKARPINLSPSQKIIREYKKSERQKYATSQIPPTTFKTSENEWQVLYTTQLTQKSRKYHDGFLRFSASGALERQVMLFDEQRNLLESRFLKKDVLIRSGESISLDAHLVEIGECNGNNIQGNDNSTGGNLGVRHEQKIRFQSDGTSGKDDKKCEVQKFGVGCSPACTLKSGITEWQVMYTTQVTQKAKKYHDGFLQMTNSGTLQRQIMLYDESKKLINSRFLKKDEVIQSGESITFDAHLVDVGEPKENDQGCSDSFVHESNFNVAGKLGLMHRAPNSLKTSKSFFKGKPQTIACSGGHVADPSFSTSSINETNLSQDISAKKPLRDAIQIISILQKPMTQNSIARGSIHKNIMNPFPEEPQNSDSPRNIPECSQLPRISAAHRISSVKTETHESIESVDIKKSPNFYSKDITSCSGNEPFKNTEVGKSQQLHSDTLEACCQETAAIANNSVELKISRETGGRPSFDLGFD